MGCAPPPAIPCNGLFDIHRPKMPLRSCVFVLIGLCLAHPGLADTARAAALPQTPRIAETTLAVSAGFEHNRNATVLVEDADGRRPENDGASTQSAFLDSQLGLDLELPLASGQAWIGTLDLNLRRYAHLPELNRDKIALRTGPGLPLGDAEAELLLAIDTLSLGGGDFRRRALGLEINRTAAVAGGRGKSRLLWQRQRHAGLDDLYDRDRLALDHAQTWASDGPWRPSWTVRGGWQSERNRWGYDDLSSRGAHLELEFQVSPRTEWTFIAWMGVAWTRYGGPAPDEDFTRRDRRQTLALAVEYPLDDAKNFRCDLETLRQNSNDSLAEARSSRLGCGLEWAL